MDETRPRQAVHRRPVLIRVIVLLDFVLLLFPPFHWWFGAGNVTVSLWFFLGTAALVTLSLPLMRLIEGRRQTSGTEG